MPLHVKPPKFKAAPPKNPSPSETFQAWMWRWDAAKRARDPHEKEWERYKRYYKNEFYGPISVAKPNPITVNQVFVLDNIYESVVCAKNPYIYLKPVREEFSIGAVITEALINYYWRELDIKRITRKIVRDTVLCSGGWGEVGFTKAFSNEKVVRRKGLYFQRISPWNIWSDPDSEYSGDDTEYFRIQREIWPYHVFKKEYPQAAPYAKLYKPQWPSLSTSQAKLAPAPTAISKDDPLARVAVYRIQDIENDKFFWFIEGYNDWLDEIDNPFDVEGFLTENLIFHEIPEEPYGMSVIRPVEGQQLELNKIRNMWMNHRKRFNRRYLAGAGAFESGETGTHQRELLKSGEDGSICDVLDINQIKALEDASMPEDIAEHEMRVKEDWRDGTVVNEYLRAGAVPRIKTAYETSEIVAGTKLRLGTLIDDTKEFYRRIAKKLIQIMQQKLPEPIVVQIAGAKGVAWGHFTRKQIQGEYECVIYPGEMAPKDEERSRLLAERFYNTFRPDPNVDQRRVLRKSLEMWGIEDPDTFIIQGQVSPFAAQGAGKESGGTASGILKALKGGVTPNEGM